MTRTGTGAAEADNAADTVLTTVRQQLQQVIRQFDQASGNQTRHRVANSAVNRQARSVK